MHSRSNAGLKLIIIIVVYLALAIGYSLVTPIGRGADEWAHYWYAQFIAQHRRLPLTLDERDLAGYKSDWPPLYHTLVAAATGWIDTAGPPDFKYRADSIRRQLIPADGSDAILHTEDELFPWRQEILVWHLGRFLSIIFSTLTLLVTYFVALEVFGGAKEQRSRGAEEQVASRKVAGSSLLHVSRFTFHAPRPTLYAPSLPAPHTLALAATAVLAFNPRFLFTGMLFNYDSLTLLLASLFLWLAIRVTKGYHSRWGFWTLGALAGLALVTKYLTLLLPLVIVWVAGMRSRQFWQRLAQAALAYLLVVSGWFGYLIINFNEVDEYGPVLGTLAPLIRGDSSDRTVEQIFAWLSGGQSPPPAYIEQQSYTAWQILAELPLTFWGNPITRPYPLTWFIMAMTLVMALALVGLLIYLRFTTLAPERTLALAGSARGAGVYDLRLDNSQFPIPNSQFTILILVCLLPLPFMLIRLFGARDALEAVQGRHLLFLAGPALAILLVLGLSVGAATLAGRIAGRKLQVAGGRVTSFALYGLLGLLLTGALGQLLFMGRTYSSPLPVRMMALHLPLDPPPAAVTLPGGATLSHYSLLPAKRSNSLKVSLYWQGGQQFAPEDYQTELELVDSQGQIVSGWRGYQTQARYPTRAWEPGDTIRDDGWLPLTGLSPGVYEIRLRILGEAGPVVDWLTITQWQLTGDERALPAGQWLLWHNGQIVQRPPLFRERETVQVTYSPLLPPSSTPLQLVGPDGSTYNPISSGPGWANFIIGPDWPAGAYNLGGVTGTPLLRVAANGRDFQLPPMAHPLEANFAGKIKLLGYDLPSRRVEPGQGLPITLYWQGQEWPGEDFVIFARLLDNAQVARGGYDRRARENYSTLLWAPGEIVADGFAVPVAADAPDGVYTLSLGWYREVNGQAQSLPILDPETGEPTGVTAVTIGPVKVGGPPPAVIVPQANPAHPVHGVFGQQVELLGFNSALNPQQLDLTLFWQSLTQPQADYTLFVHVRDAAGRVVAQKDSPPVGGAYPTTLWDAGEIIKDDLVAPLADLPPGEYEVVVGLYDYITGVRLPVEGSPEDSVFIMKFSRLTGG